MGLPGIEPGSQGPKPRRLPLSHNPIKKEQLLIYKLFYFFAGVFSAGFAVAAGAVSAAFVSSAALAACSC